ncbi:hypothetical protein RCS87_09350 [Thiothrix lacustris]|nr:hypothetical protein [Thiothrix lacustris]WMP19236.1 hypothetical protein RCS87_09350 [Thiothrix lacustris]
MFRAALTSLSCSLPHSAHVHLTYEWMPAFSSIPTASLPYLPIVRLTLEKYQNLEPDFTDAALVTLAGLCKIRDILTVDERDFSFYRLADGSCFERLWV